MELVTYPKPVFADIFIQKGLCSFLPCVMLNEWHQQFKDQFFFPLTPK